MLLKPSEKECLLRNFKSDLQFTEDGVWGINAFSGTHSVNTVTVLKNAFRRHGAIELRIRNP